MKWHTGRHTSIPADFDDGRCFLEKHGEGEWYVYQTGDDGRLMKGFPKMREEPFESVEAAQKWVEENVPYKHVSDDVPLKGFHRRVKRGEMKIEFADTTHQEALQPWIDQILAACGITGAAMVSDKSLMGHFRSLVADREKAHEEIQQRLGMAFETSDYVYDVARRLKAMGEA